jgi:hypothetical protein
LVPESKTSQISFHPGHFSLQKILVILDNAETIFDR